MINGRRNKLNKYFLIKNYLERFLQGERHLGRHDIYLALTQKFIHDNSDTVLNMVCPICGLRYSRVSAYVKHLDEHGVFSYIIDRFSSLECEVKYVQRIRDGKRIISKCVVCNNHNHRQICVDTDVFDLWQKLLDTISFRLV